MSSNSNQKLTVCSITIGTIGYSLADVVQNVLIVKLTT